LKMSPFDREPVTSYWCSIVTALSRVNSEIFNIEKYPYLKNLGQGSIIVIKSGTIRKSGYDFVVVFYSNFVPKSHRF